MTALVAYYLFGKVFARMSIVSLCALTGSISGFMMPSVMKQAVNVLARCVVMSLAVWFETTHSHGLAEFV